MSGGRPHVVILGAGPAGLGAAYRLARRGSVGVPVIVRHLGMGGHAASFELAGQMVDHGSHRLHPACAPDVLEDIRTLLGRDLRDRPRHARIRLAVRWIDFPLRPVDLGLGLPPRFALGVGAGILRQIMGLGRRPRDAETFASVLEAGLGATICRAFYFPYAEKVWGVSPSELAAVQAHRRVGARSLGTSWRPGRGRRPWRSGSGSGFPFWAARATRSSFAPTGGCRAFRSRSPSAVPRSPPDRTAFASPHA